ncbi:MAG: zinc dependent phospholipase C family protein, partial [Treponema sp.]|nr:zinc dependent phospholipase C family protein [Treponema sp.]
MPSQILHALFGEDVITGIYRRIVKDFGIEAGKALEKIRLHYKAAFTLGCQGPDIFYHNQKTRPVALEYGALLHRRSYGVFTAALLKMGLPDPPPEGEDIRSHRRGKGISALGAYALGFMTHAFLDRFCHPYIIYKAGWVSRRDPATRRFAGAHVFFERLLDVLMLEYLRGQPVSSWDQGALAAVCADPPPGLKELLARALVSAFPERAGRDTRLVRRMENAFSDCASFYRLTDPQKTSLCPPGRPQGPAWARGIPVAYLYPEQFPRDLDYLNLKKGTWYSPAGEGGAENRSFP